MFECFKLGALHESKEATEHHSFRLGSGEVFLTLLSCCIVLKCDAFSCRIEDVENLTSEKNRLSHSLDQKTKKVLDLETK